MRGELHYTLTRPEQLSGALGNDGVQLAARYNIVPGQTAAVVLRRESNRACEQLRWGLLPRWRGHGGKRGPLVHSVPVEAVPGTPLLRDAFKNQRCLVLADGCYAWRELKQPIWCHPEPFKPVAFAGIWAINDDDGVPSFALLLGLPLVTRVNDPMPIVLSEDAYDTWLDPAVNADSASELLTHAPVVGWRADAVSTRMRSAHDDAKCIEPLGNPLQGELF
jgi:putative SOS response-associated peptidase YedK